MNNFTHTPRAKRGFTLIELMVVLAIISILAAIAYPSYRDSVIRSKRETAKADLQAMAQAMEKFRMKNNTYLGAAANAGNTGSPTIFPTQSPLDATLKTYNLTIDAATASTFTLKATPIATGTNKNDGYLTLQHNNARSRVIGSVTKSWDDR